MRELTKKEQKAIAALEKVSKIWPKSLWLFSGSGTLHVMRTGPDGAHMTIPGYREGGIDPDYSITTIDIDNDGGDW